MNETRKPKSGWTRMRRVLVTLAILATLTAIFYTEENWRGKRAWEDCKRELEAKGETLDWNAFIPAPVPDESNVFAAHMMADWFVRQAGQPGTLKLYEKLKFIANLSIPTPLTDLTPQKATNFLALCVPAELELKLFGDALRRPFAGMNGDYEIPFGRPLPDLVSYRALSLVLAERSRCFLVLGQPEKAIEELQQLYALDRLLNAGPQYSFTVMFEISIMKNYWETINEGLRHHLWQEPQLTVLQQQLSEINLLPLLAKYLRVERAGMVRTMEIPEGARLLAWSDPSTPTFWQKLTEFRYLAFTLMPRGWVYQNIATLASLEQEIILSFPSNQIVAPHAFDERERIMIERVDPRTPFNFLAVLAIPNFQKVVEITVRNQTWANETQIACALERYRLANKKLPEALEALVPQFIETIPNDIIGGKPLVYRRAIDSGDYLLYSVGWNETDDGGQVAPKIHLNMDWEHGDWVWPME